ncbi:MAG: hypothetical protein M3O32_15590 [Actinomycetota bacterium]|nr:hypothetical protein [Actinomycetota bacterium]
MSDTPTMEVRPGTRDVLDALRRHLDGSKWAALEEVERIDLLAVGCWRSTGYRWHGYEVKVSRSDWRRELAKPGKAQAHLCHAWTVVTLPGVVKDGELPAGWGLSVLNGSGRIHALHRPTVRPSPLLTLDPADFNAYSRLVLQAAIARRAFYAESDARALVEFWPGSREQLAAALVVAQKRTGRFGPGIGVYGKPKVAVASAGEGAPNGLVRAHHERRRSNPLALARRA